MPDAESTNYKLLISKREIVDSSASASVSRLSGVVTDARMSEAISSYKRAGERDTSSASTTCQ